MKLNSLLINMFFCLFTISVFASDEIIINMDSLKNREKIAVDENFVKDDTVAQPSEVRIIKKKRGSSSKHNYEVKTKEDIAQDRYRERLRKIRNDLRQGKVSKDQAIHQLLPLYKKKKPDSNRIVKKASEEIVELQLQMDRIKKEIKQKKIIEADPNQYYILKAKEYLGLADE